MTERPAYKSHPLWNDAMSLTRDAYAVAEQIVESEPDASRRLRKAAVAVPAHVASALTSGPGKRYEYVRAARGALAEVSRQAQRSRRDDAQELARRAKVLDRTVLFELGAPETVF